MPLPLAILLGAAIGGVLGFAFGWAGVLLAAPIGFALGYYSE